MKEVVRNAVWGMGVRALHFGKYTGLTGPFEHTLMEIANRFIPPPSEEVEVNIPLGMQMAIPPGFPRARTYAAGLYEQEVTRLVQDIVREGMTVVDIGAFCGYYSLLASRLAGSSGRVYAFEPYPVSYEYLLRNIEANGCHNVMAVNKAVCDGTGIGALTIHSEVDHHWLSTISSNGASGSIPTVSLDDFFAEQGWPAVDVIKMDIEGGEKTALEGMRELSQRNPGLRLIMEFDIGNLRRSGATVEGLAAVLTELGFRTGHVIEQHLRPFSIPQSFPRSHATYDLLITKETKEEM